MFGHDGDGVRVEDVRVIDTVPPVGVPLHDLTGRSGFWCELRDSDGAVLHRQVLRDPRHPTGEIAAERRHVPRPVASGAFTVVTPDGGATVALVQRRATDAGPVDVLTARVPGARP